MSLELDDYFSPEFARLLKLGLAQGLFRCSCFSLSISAASSARTEPDRCIVEQSGAEHWTHRRRLSSPSDNVLLLSEDLRLFSMEAFT